MRYILAEDYEEGSRKTADLIEGVIRENQKALLGLATGDTPRGTYKYLREDFFEGKVDFSEVRTINLDEYVGLPGNHCQSFAYFMHRELFSKVNIRPENIMLIDGEGDPEAEAERYDSFLKENTIDLQLLGIGENGHIGFNEPEAYFTANTHLTELAEGTIRANSRFFKDISEVPKRAVTMGVSGIINAKKIVMAAYGHKKAPAIKRLLCDDKIYPEFPCSILKACRDVTLITDRELYELIKDSCPADVCLVKSGP